MWTLKITRSAYILNRQKDFESESRSASDTTSSKDKLQKIYTQLGHSTRTQMHSFMKGTQKWRPQCARIINKGIEECACSVEAAPVLCLACSGNYPPKVDKIYLQTKPFLHVVDYCSRWSETELLRTRHFIWSDGCVAADSVAQYRIRWLIWADQEYDKDEVLKFYAEYDIQVIAFAGNHHEGNSHMEKANRSVCSYFDGLVITEPRPNRIGFVVAETFFRTRPAAARKALLLSNYIFLYPTSLCFAIHYNMALQRKTLLKFDTDSFKPRWMATREKASIYNRPVCFHLAW